MTGVRRDVVPISTFDTIDEAIVAQLIADGRMALEELARRLGLPRAKVRSHTKRLIDSGALVVRGLVHPSFFGRYANAHVMIGCTGPAATVAAAISELDDVVLVSLVSGRKPIVAEVRTVGRAKLTAILAAISAVPSVQTVEASMYLDIVLGAGDPPPPSAVSHIDDIDRQLLIMLQADGRRSFASLADDVGLSIGAARSRVLRLLAARVVSIHAQVPPSAVGAAQIGIGVSTIGDPEPVLANLRSLAILRYLAPSLGRWTAVGTIHVAAGMSEWDALDLVRAVPGVVDVESWRHLQFVKDRYAESTIRPESP